MSNSSEFLRAFFNDNNLFVPESQNGEDEAPKKTKDEITKKINKNQENSEQKLENNIIRAPQESWHYKTKKEINLKKMFWALEQEEKEFIKEFKKEQKNREAIIKKSHPMPWVQQDIRNTFSYFLQSTNAFLETAKPENKESSNELILEKKQFSKLILQPKKGRPKKIKIDESFSFRISRGNQKYREEPTVYRSEEKIESEPVLAEEKKIPPILPEPPRTEEHFRVSGGEKPEYRENTNYNILKEKNTPQKKAWNILDAKAAYTQNAIETFIEKSQNIIATQTFEAFNLIKTFFSKSQNFTTKQSHALVNSIITFYRKSKDFTKKIQNTTEETIRMFFEKSQKNITHQTKIIKKYYTNFLQKKQKSKIQKEEHLLFEAEERKKLEMLLAEKRRKEEIEKAEKLSTLLAAKKQEEENLSSLSFQPSVFSKITQHRRWKEAKEMLHIAGMVAGVFLIGTVGLSLPGWMQQYEHLWNADAFMERQASMDLLVNDASTIALQKLQNLPVAGEENTNPQKESISIAPPDTRIVIPKIAQNIPIVFTGENARQKEDWNLLEKEIQKGLQEGVVHYPGTANPGDTGNVFITGHSSYYAWDKGRYKDVFAPLHNLDVGDEYFIYHKGKKYNYKIVERKIVPPSDTSVLDQDFTKKESTLMTCTPIGTAKNRLIIKAEQVKSE